MTHPYPAGPWIPDPEAIPAELRARPQWVRFTLIPQEGKKPKKVPLRPSGPGAASSTDPSTWGDFATAHSNIGRDGAVGVGYVFTEDDPFVGADFDDVLEDGRLHPAVAPLVEALATYTEVSPSGCGVKAIGRRDHPVPAGTKHKAPGPVGEIEWYQTERFFALTGNLLPGAPEDVRPVDGALDAILERYFKPNRPRSEDDVPDPADELHADDAAGLAMRLVSRATAAIARGAKRHDTIRGAVLQARHNRIPYEMVERMLPALLDAANAIPGKEPYPLSQLQRLLRWTWEHVTPGEPWEATKRKLESYREDDEQPDAAALPVLIGEALEEPAPDIAWLIEDFLPTGALALVAAYGGVGKTTLIVQLCASLAAGRDVLGFRVPQAVPCLYLIAEGARHVFLSRVKVALARLGLDPTTLPLWITPREFTAEIGPKLAEYIERTGARFVVLDTFGLFHDGDENSASDFKAKVVKPLRAIMARHDVSFVLVTHEVKPNAERKGRHRVRGTSALVDDSDVAIRLEAPEGDRATARLLIFEKIRTGAAIEPIPLEFVPSAAIFERVGEEVMRERQAERSAEADARRLKDLEVQVVRYLKRDPDGLTKAELTAEVHPRRADLVRVLDKLRDESRAFPERDPKGRAMRWRLAAAPRLEMAG